MGTDGFNTLRQHQDAGKNDFFMDRYEVTNKQYKEFVDAGGYRNPEYWKFEFVKKGKTLTWEEAMSELTDKTDRPGPAEWEAGTYPDDQDNYPVSGVSWYEAAAYAAFAGKELPTVRHWYSDAGLYIDHVLSSFAQYLIPLSNMKDEGPHRQAITGVWDVTGTLIWRVM